jgi:hypothetical protein
MTQNNTKENERAREQAKAQLESIVEMVAKLDREKAAELYARDISRERCVELLTEAGIDTSDDETAEDLREAVAANIADETIEPEDFEFDEDAARETIQEDALDIQVRSDWYSPGDADGAKPAEFMILLCTGGPAVRIIGDLDNGEPSRARIEYQDWFTPWTELVDITSDEREALLTYSRTFYFGE